MNGLWLSFFCRLSQTLQPSVQAFVVYLLPSMPLTANFVSHATLLLGMIVALLMELWKSARFAQVFNLTAVMNPPSQDVLSDSHSV